MSGIIRTAMVVLLLYWIVAWSVAAFRPQSTNTWVVVMPAPDSGGVPSSIVVRTAVPDEAQICLEITSGKSRCRTVRALRDWIQP